MPALEIGYTLIVVPAKALLSVVDSIFQFPFNEKSPPVVLVGSPLITSQLIKRISMKANAVPKFFSNFFMISLFKIQPGLQCPASQIICRVIYVWVLKCYRIAEKSYMIPTLGQMGVDS